MQSIEFPNVEFPGRKECIDLSDYCRLCLQLPDESDLLDLQLIYDEEENLSYYECFTICTQLDLRAGGTYAPHQLCKSCGLELQVAYDFHKKVEESKKFLVQFEKSATSNNVVEAPVVTMPSEVKSIQQRFAVEMVEGNVDNIHYETRILPLEPLESGTVPEPLESEITKEEEDVTSHLQTSMEYEELEEQVDMLDEYQSVDELVDEDTDNDDPVTALKFEEESIHFPAEITYDNDGDNESSEQYTNVETTQDTTQEQTPLVLNFAPPSDADDINLEEYIFENTDLIENPDSIEKPTVTQVTQEQQPDSSTQPSTSYRRPGRTPLIPGGPPYQCEYCEHTSKTRSLLASHRFRKHRFNKPLYKCNKCDKDFATQPQLKRHMQRVTCETYPEFKCEFCEKVCTGRANYQIHLRFHRKVYPFVCHICAKPFMLAIHMNNHVKTKHEGQRFICEYENCGRMFQTAHALKNHVYTHVEQLPYRCDYCQNEFSAKGRLRWHISRSHGIEHTLDELDCMLVAKEIKVKAQLQPALPPEPEPRQDVELTVLNESDLEEY